MSPAGDLVLSDPPADIPVYGTSFAMLLDTALDNDGDIDHTETARLDSLGRPAGP